MPKHLALARSLLLLLPPLPPFYNSMVLYNGSPAVPLRVKCLWCNYVFPSTASRGYPSPAGFICKPVHYVFREVRLRRQNNSHNSLCVFFLPLFNVVFFLEDLFHSKFVEAGLIGFNGSYFHASWATTFKLCFKVILGIPK